MWMVRVDVEQLLDRRAAFVDIEGYIERRCDVGVDDRDALWLYVWSRSTTRASPSAVGGSPSGRDTLGERLRSRD